MLLTDKIAPEMKNCFVVVEGFLYSDLFEGEWHLCWRAQFNRTWRAPLQNWLDNTLVIWLVDGSTFSDTTIVGFIKISTIKLNMSVLEFGLGRCNIVFRKHKFSPRLVDSKTSSELPFIQMHHVLRQNNAVNIESILLVKQSWYYGLQCTAYLVDWL